MSSWWLSLAYVPSPCAGGTCESRAGSHAHPAPLSADSQTKHRRGESDTALPAAHGSIGSGWQPHRSQPAARRAFRINISRARALPTHAISLERETRLLGGGLHWVKAELRGKTHLGSNRIWERDIDGKWEVQD